MPQILASVQLLGLVIPRGDLEEKQVREDMSCASHLTTKS